MNEALTKIRYAPRNLPRAHPLTPASLGSRHRQGPDCPPCQRRPLPPRPTLSLLPLLYFSPQQLSPSDIRPILLSVSRFGM